MDHGFNEMVINYGQNMFRHRMIINYDMIINNAHPSGRGDPAKSLPLSVNGTSLLNPDHQMCCVGMSS